MASSITTTSHYYGSSLIFVVVCSISVLLACPSNAQLSPNFYAKTCPKLQTIVQNTMKQAIAKEARMAASILRLSFHDCFVQGCDGSILLDDSATIKSEKNAGANVNSARGFDVIDTIKANVEAACKSTVSCADILALAAQTGVTLLGGPKWRVPLGRRDARTASVSLANSNLPGPGSSLSTLITLFKKQGLTANEMTALSGAHTIGQGQCKFFRNRIDSDTNIDPKFATLHKATCPATGGDSKLAPLDIQTPTRFDSAYFKDLIAKRGLFHSDQELFNGGSQDALVKTYSKNFAKFSSDFAAAMIKMTNIKPLTGSKGEIRKKCRLVN